MKLNFLSVEGRMVLVPGVPLFVGQPKRYIGKRFDPELRAHVNSDEPYSCESGSQEFHRCSVFLRRGDIRPADKATADFVGAPFDEKPTTPGKAEREKKPE